MPGCGADSHALLTRLPLMDLHAFDLHVLGLSLAFILSQDQTHVPFFSLLMSNLNQKGGAAEMPVETASPPSPEGKGGGGGVPQGRR